MTRTLGVWLPALRAGSGADVFTQRLVDELRERGICAEITWLAHRAEFAPWTVPVPNPPTWANVVHVNSWLHPRFLPRNIPVVATVHHAAHHPGLMAYKGWLQSLYHRHWVAPMERETLRRADCITAVSRFAASTARSTLLDRPMAVIYNGVDIDQFAPGQLGVAHKPFRLLYVGRWSALKGVALFAPLMRELGMDFELRYTGSLTGTDSRSMPSNMHDVGRLGAQEAVVAEMRDADAFLFPSLSEGFGLVASEAMACGLPVIATRGSSLCEVVDDGVTGILCRQGDVMAFAAAVRALAVDGAKRLTMARAARQHAVSKLDMHRMVDAYVGLYERCLGGKDEASRRPS